MLFEPLFTSAQRDPGKIAIVDDRGRYTYKQVANMAAGLGMYIGMQTQRSHVGLLLPGGAGFVASFYGTLLAGKTVVPLNFLLGDKEIAHIVKDSGIDTVLTAPPLMARMQNSGLNVVDLTQLPREIPDFQPEFPNPKADDIAVLMYTSGTSGLPKGVLLTYGNLQSDVDSAIEHAQLQHDHVFLGVIPLFHAFGMTAMMLAPLQLGATIIYIARFSPVAALNAIREHKVSLMFGVPSMYAAIARLKDAKPEDFATIYAMISGGEPLPSALRDAFMKRFNVHVFEGYGLTETSPVISLNVPQNFREGSVGRAVPGAQFKFTDEAGKALGAEEIGEIWVKGPMVMKGYNNLPTETAQALTPDGYFKTGDLGKIDPDGFIFITGRKKDMISVAGEKAYPREIEEVLMANPSVAEAAVVGKKDPSRGEVVAAFVIFKEGQTLSADALREFCREHGLAQWKIPRDIQIMTDFPRTPTGKVLKRELSAKLNG